ncbi:MAG: regulatory protein GemA [Mesorhizobium sp.]|uniref:regulatory protein GemA n=1 Tax=Mesorhizobium sp. TaxID=1871066 RepID=UPI000FD535E1|nr:regulatory protein GemA [Mesorhizobium sp.]RUU46480.1 regulatory protein GemA [Mesorhizobium sp. M6A.T.Ca.TU.002.02.2.1]RWO97187.1 MAG: regulatory protein GemA [Mesorhizobium sp.]TIM52596.1 MAG: regulatory protein GemA [Mesorhizobium sp.]
MNAIAAIHVANKQLGLDEDTARDLYHRVTGKRSLRQMDYRELQLIVTEQRRQGFKPAEKGLQGPFAKKLQALWIAAWNLGIVRERHDAALLSFVKRQTGIEHTRFLLDGDDAAKAVDALKAWMTREAGVDWSQSVNTAEWLRFPGAKIALAQWHRLSVAKAVDPKGFRQFVWDMAKPLDQMADRDWPAVMNALGDMVRKAKA